MRKLMIATVATIMLAGPAAAEDSPEQMMVDKFCNAIALAAETATRNHQEGVPLSEMLAAPNLPSYLRTMLLEIYSRPRLITPEAQAHEIADRRDRYHVVCLRELGS